MGMNSNFKLVPKFNNNLLNIWITLPNGDSKVIAYICFPADQQMGDNVKCAEELCAALKKRIRKSL